MVYFICPKGNRDTALFECEVWWNEEWSSRDNRYVWNIDLKPHFYAANLLMYYREHKNEYTDEKTFQELIDDMRKLADMRGWLWERTSLNREIDKYDPNSKKSSDAMKKVYEYCDKLIYEFADKWGFDVKID